MTRKLIAPALLLTMLPAFAWNAAPEKKQPVLVLLHARFEDHVGKGLGEDRLFRLLNLIATLRKEYPSYPVTVNLEFSGAFAQMLAKEPTGRAYIERLRGLANSGVINWGYIGDNEPTYRTRPKAKLTSGMTSEQRWLAQTTAAERFLNDFKDPLTGEQDPARSGGLKAMREMLGDPSIFGVFAPTLGGEAPYYHQLRRMNLRAVVPGFPDPYYTMNIHGFRDCATMVGAKGMVAAPETSSELFWDTNFLRASFTDSADIRGVLSEEGKQAVGQLLEKMDRSRVRLLQMEVASYARYLDKWPDGTPKLHPLVWAYDHPETPDVPSGIHAIAVTAQVQKAYAVEEETLRWLLGEFLPANPGSKIVSSQSLLKMARTPVGTEVSATTLAEAAKAWLAGSKKEMNMSPTYVQAGGNYFSAADLFQMLANGLAGVAHEGKPPASVRLTHIYGPVALESADETFPSAVIPAKEVARVAASLAPGLNDQTWKPVPSNAVPVRIEIAGKRLIPAQFLALMAEAYVAPAPDTTIPVRFLLPDTAPGYLFPRQNASMDGGHIWTLRPAPLQLD